MQKLPIITYKKDIEVKSINGQPIHSFYKQIKHILNNYDSKNMYGDLFAEPVVNDIKGEISWYTSKVGEPIKFSDLSEEKKNHFKKIFLNLKNITTQITDELIKNSGEHSSIVIALKNYFSCPNLNNSLFLCDNNLVITQWGCIPYGDNFSNFDILVQSAKLFEPLDVPEFKSNPVIEDNINIELANKKNNNSQEKFENINDDYNINNREGNVKNINLSNEAFPFFPWRLFIIFLMFIIFIISIFYYYKNNEFDKINKIRTEIIDLFYKMGKKVDNCNINQNNQPLTQDDINFRLRQNNINSGKLANISLAWSSTADLDLSIIEPSGKIIDFNNRQSPSGGQLDIDANGCITNNQGQISCNIMPSPVENISWNVPMNKGKYNIIVNLFSLKNHSKNLNLPFILSININGNLKIINDNFDANLFEVCNLNCNNNVKKYYNFIID